jgi:hypothetical protein
MALKRLFLDGSVDALVPLTYAHKHAPHRNKTNGVNNGKNKINNNANDVEKSINTVNNGDGDGGADSAASVSTPTSTSLSSVSSASALSVSLMWSPPDCAAAAFVDAAVDAAPRHLRAAAKAAAQLKMRSAKNGNQPL